VTGSGLSAAPLTFYIRRATKDLWEHLSGKKTDVSFITGSPGIGKSLEVYAYAMRQPSAHNQRVIYVRSIGNMKVNLVSADNNGVRFGNFKMKRGYTLPLEWFLRSALEQNRVDLIVLDGQLGDDLYSFVFTLLPAYPGVRLITCTCFQAVQVKEEQLDNSPSFQSYVVDSWTLEEQRAAVRKKALVLHPTVTSVDEAHFYAGGSARLLQWPVDKVVNTIDLYINSLDHDALSTLLGNTNTFGSSKTAENELISFVGGKSVFTSSYIMRRWSSRLSAFESLSR